MNKRERIKLMGAVVTSCVCMRRTAWADGQMKTKIYNVSAWGIPNELLLDVAGWLPLPLSYTNHAMGEALNDRYGTLAGRHFPTKLEAGWKIVEVESSFPGKVDKVVVRKPVDDRRSLVLVIRRGGVVDEPQQRRAFDA